MDKYTLGNCSHNHIYSMGRKAYSWPESKSECRSFRVTKDLELPKVLYCGSWNFSLYYCRYSSRFSLDQSSSYALIGFRVIK